MLVLKALLYRMLPQCNKQKINIGSEQTIQKWRQFRNEDNSETKGTQPSQWSTNIKTNDSVSPIGLNCLKDSMTIRILKFKIDLPLDQRVLLLRFYPKKIIGQMH